MLRGRFTVASLHLVLLGLGYQPLAALGQSPDVSNLRTTLKDTDPIDVGTVTSRGPNSITVKNNLFTRAFRINAQTAVLRVDSSPLEVGDLVTIRCHFDKGAAIADFIEANVDHWEGVITKVLKGTVYLKFDAPVQGSARVVLDARTEFRYCTGDDLKRNCTLGDLKVGRHLDTVGFVPGKSDLRATRVLSIQDH